MTTTTPTTKKKLGASYHKLFISTAISNVGDGMSLIAYPWLASALTRNPLLIAAVALVQRLPWLIFTLPAGVITDRVDRKKAMVYADVIRFGLTLVVAIAVLGRQSSLPGADELSKVTGTSTGLYTVLLVATLLLGTAEVLRDNCGQTFMPSIVEVDQLEKANGRMWSAEGIANTFVGPPLGSLLLLVAFSLPFFVDAASFFAAAALVAAIPGTFRAERPDDHVQAPWRSELAEGFRWLWSNDLLRSMAIILGLMNLASALSGSVLVLFAQEILHVGPFAFTIMGFGFAAGGAIGSNLAPWLSKRLGSGTCLAMTLGSSAVVSFVVGLLSWWPLVMVVFGIGATVGATWNVITVSLRQSIIPPHLL
ncbi:MAG TPA: MFS transporter, partial [Ilumatobacteraceae bacterium]|nr:MFS transporter [Ilumatobacteraceae bacterium]